MQPVVRHLIWSVLLPAAVGGTMAAGICLWWVPGGEKLPEPIRNTSLYRAVHRPSVPVSSPLVLPPVPTPVTSSPPAGQSHEVVAVRDTLNLPSFAPLVHQVIPAVVNISISHGSAAADSDDDDDDATNPSSREPSSASAQSRRKKHVRRHTSNGGKPHHVLHPADDELTGAGSGFVVDASGIIVTNRHVIGHATRIMVSLSDGRSLPAHSLGDDPMTDIAVIKVDSATPLPCVAWGDSRQVEIGDWILVAGNPFGFGSSVTAGIVSAVGRDLGSGALDDFMQLDAPINPGNSGGPAFNLQGQVVAMNAAIASPSDGSVGIGFGIPSEIVAPVVESIRKTGHVEHGWLGVTLNDASSPMWVEDVDPHGAAWRGGLRKRDAILAIGDVPVHDARTVLRSVAAAHPGTIFNFTIRREGKVMTLPVALGKRPMADF
ncbi:trypsin-like peptidase domain-containing protein [Bombella sp. TMW 2.2559]|uniref:Trypsin-like peptidase domain-containing protein n=1 Tax=Bombella dulcis TaxID=2967339 RepID=A0ABT3WBE7_9PROT|nr:trypsin-like peptidase domain-containing protein [Bombella dulcis]MCX5616148.1 trypsin-like peptidase domain-containing protein [Bombella dulcis]